MVAKPNIKGNDFVVNKKRLVPSNQRMYSTIRKKDTKNKKDHPIQIFISFLFLVNPRSRRAIESAA